MNRRSKLLLGASLLLALLSGIVVAQATRSLAAMPTTPQELETEEHAFFAFAGTLPMLVNGGNEFPKSDLIVQGQVTSARVYQAAAPSLPPKRGVNFPTQEPHTAYTIAVSEAVDPTATQSPAEVTVTMWGGVVDGKPKHIAEFPLLEVGGEYLLFLVRQPDGTYQTNGGPQGYLRVKGGKAEPVAQAPVIDQFAGKDVAEVKRQVKGAKQK